jgi:hypothetical protein
VEDFAPINLRHQHVQDEPVVPRATQLFERLAATGGGFDVEPIRDKDHSLKSGDVFLIFNHENLHGSPSY